MWDVKLVVSKILEIFLVPTLSAISIFWSVVATKNNITKAIQNLLSLSVGTVFQSRSKARSIVPKPCWAGIKDDSFDLRLKCTEWILLKFLFVIHSSSHMFPNETSPIGKDVEQDAIWIIVLNFTEDITNKFFHARYLEVLFLCRGKQRKSSLKRSVNDCHRGCNYLDSAHS